METLELLIQTPVELRSPCLLRDPADLAPVAIIVRQAPRSVSLTPRQWRPLSAISNSRLEDGTNPRQLLSNDPRQEFDPAPRWAALQKAARPGSGARVRSNDACISRIRPDAIRNLRDAISRARPQDTRWRRRDRNQRMP